MKNLIAALLILVLSSCEETGRHVTRYHVVCYSAGTVIADQHVEFRGATSATRGYYDVETGKRAGFPDNCIWTEE